MKMKILKKHFDAAVKQEWGASTCILSQAGKGVKYPFRAISPSIGTQIAQLSFEANAVMTRFDRHFQLPRDVSKKILQKLRASLPIVIELPAKEDYP